MLHSILALCRISAYHRQYKALIMEHSEHFDCSPRRADEVLVSVQYEAGITLVLQVFGHHFTATPSWRAGWNDADHDVQSGVLNSRSAWSESTSSQWSTFGTGWDARLCELPFDVHSSPDWKRE